MSMIGYDLARLRSTNPTLTDSQILQGWASGGQNIAAPRAATSTDYAQVAGGNAMFAALAVGGSAVALVAPVAMGGVAASSIGAASVGLPSAGAVVKGGGLLGSIGGLFQGILNDEFGSGNVSLPSNSFTGYTQNMESGQNMAGFTDALGGVVQALGGTQGISNLVSGVANVAGVSGAVGSSGMPTTLPAGWSWRTSRKGNRPYKPYKQMSAAERAGYWQGRRVGKMRGIQSQRRKQARFLRWRTYMRPPYQCNTNGTTR